VVHGHGRRARRRRHDLPLLHREREDILDLFESLVGARLLYGFFPGRRHALRHPGRMGEQCRTRIDRINSRIDEYEQMLEDNAFFLARTQGVGVVSRELAQDVGISGPLLRGSGVNYDIRRTCRTPRTRISISECRWKQRATATRATRCAWSSSGQSIAIVRQALDKLPSGPISSRPALKSVAQIRIPKGEAYARVEGPRGEVGSYIISTAARSRIA
jgi:NADH-quinone oxidoreductase subunit D